MPTFESGVYAYIHGEYTVKVHFPVNHRGEADISCYQCQYFRRNYQTCGLNNTICEYPSKYVGSQCPLKITETTEREKSNEKDTYTV